MAGDAPRRTRVRAAASTGGAAGGARRRSPPATCAHHAERPLPVAMEDHVVHHAAVRRRRGVLRRRRRRRPLQHLRLRDEAQRPQHTQHCGGVRILPCVVAQADGHRGLPIPRVRAELPGDTHHLRDPPVRHVGALAAPPPALRHSGEGEGDDAAEARRWIVPPLRAAGAVKRQHSLRPEHVPPPPVRRKRWLARRRDVRGDGGARDAGAAGDAEAGHRRPQLLRAPPASPRHRRRTRAHTHTHTHMHAHQ